jgi:2-keto-4-pentenoate hydratase
VTSPAASPDDLERFARALATAREDHIPIPPLTDAASELRVEDAYAIAERNIRAQVKGGARIVGHKVGLTSTAVQRQLGVNQPDYGALLDVMQIADGATVDTGDYISPRIELELAFHLGRGLRGPGVRAPHVRAATQAVQPAIELVDSRIAAWRIGLADTIADNASSGGFVLGGDGRAIDDLDVTAVQVELWRGQQIVERGASSAVLGDPCDAVAWLANALGELGVSLEAGHIVLSGACTRMVDARPGDAFRGVFSGFGDVRLTFASSTPG